MKTGRKKTALCGAGEMAHEYEGLLLCQTTELSFQHPQAAPAPGDLILLASEGTLLAKH